MASSSSTNGPSCLSASYSQIPDSLAIIALTLLLMIAPSLPCVDQEHVSIEFGIDNGDHV